MLRLIRALSDIPEALASLSVFGKLLVLYLVVFVVGTIALSLH